MSDIDCCKLIHIQIFNGNVLIFGLLSISAIDPDLGDSWCDMLNMTNLSSSYNIIGLRDTENVLGGVFGLIQSLFIEGLSKHSITEKLMP